MSRQINERTTLDQLRREAKRWLRHLHDGESNARARLRTAWPAAPDTPVLRDVQHALAREHGLENWVALKDALALAALAHKSRAERVDDFLELACLHYGVRPGSAQWNERAPDLPAYPCQAARLLARDPGLADAGMHTAVVSGNLAAVQRLLAADPSLARKRGGREQWEPLLFLCYGRLPAEDVEANSVAIARLLLQAGADAGAEAIAGDPAFSALTGVIGGGENAQPAHPCAPELAALLIAHGADPYDRQALYDTSLEGDDTFWLECLYCHCAQRGESGLWTAPSDRWPRSSMLDYLLGNAVSRNALARARWLLDHGANANARNFYSKRLLHTDAVLLGNQEMADLLAGRGAVAEPLAVRERFHAACARADAERMHALLAMHPDLLADGTPLVQAAQRNRADIAARLLDMGMSPDVHGHDNFRPLHAAAMAGAVDVARLLLQRGAQVDPVETRFGGTPLSWALHYRQTQTAALLGALSLHPQHLVEMGNLARLQQLEDAEPGFIRAADTNAPLFPHLPDDADAADEIAQWLLQHGADPWRLQADGIDGIAQAERRGLIELADWMRAQPRPE